MPLQNKRGLPWRRTRGRILQGIPDCIRPRTSPPAPAVLSFMAKLREEPESDGRFLPRRRVPGKFAGHRGKGKPTQVGVGHGLSDLCDGQSLASPGRWPLLLVFTRRRITEIESRASSNASQIITVLKSSWYYSQWERWTRVRSLFLKSRISSAPQTNAVFIWKLEIGRTDYRFLQMLLQLAKDPEVGRGGYSQGVRVGPGTKMPRLPALCRPKGRWRLASQQDPLDYLEQTVDQGGIWRRNYSSLAAYEDRVLEVMRDQASRGQPLVLTESEARKEYPDLVIASLGAQRKEKPGGKITARVLSTVRMVYA